MKIKSLNLPDYFKSYYTTFPHLTPIQEKAINAGLLNRKNVIACAPTASGKTLVATMGIVNTLGQGKAIYLVPLKALANEKFKEYQKLLENTPFKVIMSTSDIDSESGYLEKYDLLVLTTEKLDSLLRHRISWLSQIITVVIDEIHLLNDASRGPTLEIVLTILNQLIQPQLIGLSATIGNPRDLTNWLKATLIQDNWRPVELKKGIHCEGKTEFYGDHK